MRIFVSYTIRDGCLDRPRLERISAELSRFGEPYVDMLHNCSPDPQQYVLDMLGASEALFACLTPRFLDSEWVREELALAHKRQIPVYGLCLRGIGHSPNDTARRLARNGAACKAVFPLPPSSRPRCTWMFPPREHARFAAYPDGRADAPCVSERDGGVCTPGRGERWEL